ncbi:MAG: hypothetical protein LBM77_00245 [Spirochaetaceae bacterium]|jgi:hypothetical protein|nr:hypothetical protein [Spirochaetaceae bacterium]
MAFKKWRESSIFTKIASIGMAVSAVLSIILGFSLVNDADVFGVFGQLGISTILYIYILLFFVIDIIVALGLFFVARWAKSWTIYWGVLSVISIVTSISSPSAWLLPSILQAASAVLVVLDSKDFPEKQKHPVCPNLPRKPASGAIIQPYRMA